MRLARLIYSTPFRIAVIITLMAIGAFLASAALAYTILRTDLDAAHTRGVSELHYAIAQSYVEGGEDSLADSVQANILAAARKENVFRLLAPDGRVLATNVNGFDIPPGFSDVPARRLGIDRDVSYRILNSRVGDFELAVGSSNADIEIVRETIFKSFGWAAAGMILLSLAGGAYLAAKTQRRLDQMQRTFDEISLGHLGARLPIRNQKDDVDVLWRNVNAALDRLSHLVEGMRQVSNDIAHDLKTPLNRLRITIETALLHNEKGQPVTELLERAASESDHINETFAALLAIAQIEAGARKARFGVIDLRAILSDIAEVYTNVAEDAGDVLDYATSDDAPVEVQGDRELVTQALANLIENAIRHCPPGSHINCSIDTREGGVAVIVADDGPGIPADEREKVRERFYRLEKSRTTPGSGLGLSLVNAIAELHGGGLVLEDNRPGLRATLLFSRGADAVVAHTEE
ncbi:sensor histidine kinase [Oricola nitratireducens]|uniref:sensor histidine kinase n=1 Tax=Oricola nitratireducens TaxID=2775868 RepID=UPI001867BB5B|nr:HAMP domain-containing sensor histidine kinase [Oricola nitratireducens]